MADPDSREVRALRDRQGGARSRSPARSTGSLRAALDRHDLRGRDFTGAFVGKAMKGRATPDPLRPGAPRPLIAAPQPREMRRSDIGMTTRSDCATFAPWPGPMVRAWNVLMTRRALRGDRRPGGSRDERLDAETRQTRPVRATRILVVDDQEDALAVPRAPRARRPPVLTADPARRRSPCLAGARRPSRSSSTTACRA